MSDSDDQIPRLHKRGGATQLLVDGAPFIVLGGELGNSTASSPESLAAAWPRLAALGLNTALLPAYWELCEPEEGRFDFGLIDHAIDGARRHGMRLVLLWFGSWKNSMSCYAPAWVKGDQARFPRAALADGSGLEMLSAFSDENLRADVRAFAALMRHVRARDAGAHTVVMVQVENEIAMLEDAADRSPAAREAFASPVPRALLDAVRRAGAGGDAQGGSAAWRAWRAAGQPEGGSWGEVFGTGLDADEIFMAWSYARYTDVVTRAGKEEHPLPMFVNAALNRPNRAPGEYPTGGPLPHLYDVWRAGAPSVDFLAPDIYFPDTANWCRRYARPDNPLFIPEISNRLACAVEAFYVLGEHHAIGFSPFAVDTIGDESAAALAASYATLRGLTGVITEAHGGDRMRGVLLDDGEPEARLHLAGYHLTVRHDYTFEWSSPARLQKPWPWAGALVIALGPGEYVVAGNGVIVTFAPEAAGERAGIERIDEGRFEGGRFVAGRRLNGDESHQGRHLRLPAGAAGVQRVKLYRYR